MTDRRGDSPGWVEKRNPAAVCIEKGDKAIRGRGDRSDRSKAPRYLRYLLISETDAQKSTSGTFRDIHVARVGVREARWIVKTLRENLLLFADNMQKATCKRLRDDNRAVVTLYGRSRHRETANLPDEPTLSIAQRSGEQVDLEDLRQEVLLCPSQESKPSYFECLDEVWALTGFVPHSMRQVDGMDNLAGMVAVGYGVAIVAQSTAQSPVPGCRVKHLRMPVSLPPYQLRILWRREVNSPLLQHFLASFSTFAANTQEAGSST